MIALVACSSCSVVLVIAVIGVGLTVKIEREAQRECSMKKAVLGIASRWLRRSPSWRIRWSHARCSKRTCSD